MWLINTNTLTLEFFHDTCDIPYAILSHTWEEEEVSFQDLRDLSAAKSRKGFAKIRKTCEYALQHNPPLQYCWVDTCCIDKSSSAELTEAINSMFRLYRNSTICFAYLSDLGGFSQLTEEHLEAKLAKCRWLQRGWTLQELIAPRDVVFYDSDWNSCGTKASLLVTLHHITRIPKRVLQNIDEAQDHCVARIMSWAAGRTTARVEDKAYCLLGLFGIHMPMLYGEGENAFVRLQEEIIKHTCDLSIFAWKSSSSSSPKESVRGMFAASPAEFAHCKEFVTFNNGNWRFPSEFALTNRGLRFEGWLPPGTPPHFGYLLELGCCDRQRQSENGVSIHLMKAGERGFVRIKPHSLFYSWSTPTKSDRFPYVKNERFYATKVLTASQKENIETQFHRSILIKWSPATLDVDILSAGPEQWWDPKENIFLTGVGSSARGYIRFDILLGHGKKIECLLTCGLRHPYEELNLIEFQHLILDSASGPAALPWCYLWTSESEEWERVTRYSRRNISEPWLIMRHLEKNAPLRNSVVSRRAFGNEWVQAVASRTTFTPGELGPADVFQIEISTSAAGQDPETRAVPESPLSSQRTWPMSKSKS